MFYHITSLRCKIEENDKFDPSAAAIIHDDCLDQEVLNVPLHVSKTLSLFETHYCSTSAMAIAKRVNHSAGNGLKILVEKRFLADKPVCWGETRIKKLKKLQIIW